MVLPTLDADGNVTSLADESKLFADIRYTDTQITKATKEHTAIDGKH